MIYRDNYMSNSEVSLLGDKAFTLFDRGDLNGAYAIFEKIILIDKNNAESYAMQGVIKTESGDLQDAEELIRYAIKLDSEYADAHFYLGNILQSKGKGREAMLSLEKAIDLDPEYSAALNQLNRLKLQYGVNNSQNILTGEVLLESTQKIFHQAESFVSSGNLSKAAKCYEDILLVQPTIASVWFLLGRTRSQQGQYSEAERCCLESVRLNPELVVAHIMLATLFLMQGHTELACSHSNKALSINSDDINSIALAANIAKHMNKPDRSYQLLQPLLDKGVDNINIALAFSMISKDVNKEQEAVNLLENTIRTNTSLSITARSNVHFNLGERYDSLKLYDKAFYN